MKISKKDHHCKHFFSFQMFPLKIKIKNVQIVRWQWLMNRYVCVQNFNSISSNMAKLFSNRHCCMKCFMRTRWTRRCLCISHIKQTVKGMRRFQNGGPPRSCVQSCNTASARVLQFYPVLVSLVLKKMPFRDTWSNCSPLVIPEKSISILDEYLKPQTHY